ncbi:integrase [Nitrososphaera sp.]|uniref:integrase n=1 Tax=Nitrososphaera sp. TaxID=1971748 RepID=UPI002EDB3024
MSKFNGIYDEWQKIVKRHALHWRHTDDNFNFFEKENINEMIGYIKQAIKILPKDCGNTLVVATLLGLRADETCKAIGLIKQSATDYHNKERGILEHYRHKDLFIRRSKKAYISLVDDDLLTLAKQSSDSYHSIRSYLKRRKIPMPMRYCRKVFATYLRQHGVETEFIDLLQGRTPASIFGKHYYRPDFDKQAERIRRLLPKLKKELLV